MEKSEEKRPEGIDSDWLRIEFKVPREYAGWRVDRFISNRIPRLSRTKIQRIIKKSGFDGSLRPLKPNKAVVEGDTIILFRPRPDEPEVVRSFGVVFEDEWIMGVNKPAGLPVHPTARYHQNTLTALMREHYGDDRPVMAHRIDSETSGVILFAKTKETEKLLKNMFAKRTIHKTYLAIVNGVPDPKESRVELAIGPDLKGPIRVKMSCRPDGLAALTQYRVKSEFVDSCLLECKPRTGRQHQIRVHLSHIGHPIIGDKMYGEDEDLFLDYLDSGMTDGIEKRAGAKRHFLHAAKVSLIHPMTGLELVIESPMPEDMLEYISTVGAMHASP